MCETSQYVDSDNKVHLTLAEAENIIKKVNDATDKVSVLDNDSEEVLSLHAQLINRESTQPTSFYETVAVRVFPYIGACINVKDQDSFNAEAFEQEKVEKIEAENKAGAHHKFDGKKIHGKLNPDTLRDAIQVILNNKNLTNEVAERGKICKDLATAVVVHVRQPMLDNQFSEDFVRQLYGLPIQRYHKINEHLKLLPFTTVYD